MKKTRMIPLTMKNDFSFAFKVDTIDQYRLWNLRYGHLSYSGLNLLYKKQTVRGLPLIE
jgi:hypothetical protein